MRPLYWAIGSAWLSVLMATSLQAKPAFADTIQDYLVQQVCVDASDTPTAADPTTCPGTARKLRIGEHLPYHKWDMPTQSSLAQISDSYPIADLYGRTRVVSSFFFTRAGTVPYFAPGAPVGPQEGDSAYDIMGTDGNYASILGTYDQGAGWQPFWQNAQCSLSDSWIIAPKNLPTPFGQGQASSTLTASFPQCPTVDRFSTSLTRWNSYPDYLYQSGKRLDTIKSWHFSQNSTNSDAIEVFMYTKEYGKTKWEAWQASSVVSGPNPVAVQRCGVGTNNGVANFGNTTYYLVDCHDWTFIFPAENGGWNPAQFHIDPLYNSVNLLKNTHMQCTDAGGRARPCGTSGNTCRTIAPWNRLGDLNWAYNQTPQAPRQSSNCSLLFSIPTPPSGQSVYQDTQGGLPVGSNFTYGVALRAPLSTGGTHPATVAIHQIDASGTVLSTHSVNVDAQKRYRIFKGDFIRNPAAARFRFEIYVGADNTEYEMTDAWVAPIP